MRTLLTRLAIPFGVLALLSVPGGPPASSALPAAMPGAEAPLPPGAVLRLGETRFRPGARVKHLAFSADGKQLASWGNWLYFEDRLSLWDVTTGQELHTHAVAENQIADLCWGTGGRGFAALTADGGFRVWAFADPASKPPPPGATAIMVKAIPVQKPGAQPAHGPTTYELLSFAADGTRLAAFRSGGGAATAAIDLFEAKVCAAATELKRVATRGSLPSGKCSGLRCLRGGKTVVVLTENKAGQSVVVWDTEKDTLSDPVTVPVGVRQGTRQSFDVAEAGSALAVGLQDGTVKVFDIPSGKERLSTAKHDGPKHGRRWSEVSAVKFVNGGRNILSAGRDNRQLVWDARTGAEVAALNGHGSWVEAVTVSPDGTRVATAGQDSLIRLWDATTWLPILPPQGPQETVWRLEVSRDGKYVACGSGAKLHVWELTSGQELRSAPADYRSGYVLFSPEGAVLAGDAERNLSLYPVPDGAPKPLAAKGRLLDFTPDGRTLLTAQENTVVLWDWPACTRWRTVPVSAEPLSAAISPDGKTAVIGLSGKKASALLDLGSGTATAEMPLGLHWFARAAGFAPDGRVVCGTVGSAQAEAWSILTRGLVRRFEAVPQKRPGMFYQLSFAVSPDGRRAATCHSDGGVAVYEMATGQVLADFHGHRGGAIAVAWTPDGNRVLSGGDDHQVLVWDVSLGALVGQSAPLSPADRLKAWDQLGTQSAREALRTMAALVADPASAVNLFADRLKPVPAADPAVLDRIFRALDAASFATREQAARELNGLGTAAVAGVRERSAKEVSAEVKQRVDAFLRQFEGGDLMPERIRFARALEVLARLNTPAARKLVESLAGGAPEVWETEVARHTFRWMRPTSAQK